MNWKVDIWYDPGKRMAIGNAQEKGVRLKFTDPWGNQQDTISGTKEEYGIGGFEFRVDAAAAYSLEIENEYHQVPTIDGITRLLLTRLEPEESWIPTEVSGRKVTSRGVHGPPFGQHGSWAPDILRWCERWVECNLSWMLLPSDGDDIFVVRRCWDGTELEGLSTAEVMLMHGIIPVYRRNLLKLPMKYNDWAHLDMAVPLYAKYGINKVPWKLWNEPRLDNEWVGGKAPPDWLEVYSGLFNASARQIVDRGGVAIYADAPNQKISKGEPGDWLALTEPVFDLWDAGLIVDGLHNYGHNKPPRFPNVPAVTEKKLLEQWRFDGMLGPMKWDQDWDQWPLAEINNERMNMQGPSEPDNSCYRDWENHANLMEMHFGKALLMAQCEGGWGPGDRLDPRWPRCGIEQTFWYTNEMFNDDSPLIWKCPWLVASAALGGLGWEDKTFWGGEFTKWYGFSKPVAVGTRCR